MTIKIQERTQKIDEKDVKKSFLKILKKKFVKNENEKEEEKELAGSVWSQSRSVKKFQGTPYHDIKSQYIEKLNKRLLSSHECMSASPVDGIKGRESCFFCNAVEVDCKDR